MTPHVLASMVLGVVAALSIRPSAARSEPAALTGANVEHQVGATSLAAATTARVAAPATPPTEWQPSRGLECARTGKYKGFCQGPRRVPKPQGIEAAYAERLRLGTLDAAGDLMFSEPVAEWVEAAGPDRHEALLFPVEEGMVWRGLQKPYKTKLKFHPRHKGVDIGAPEGTLIHAVKSGIVAYADNGVHGYGNLLIVVHSDASVAFYGHCKAIYLFPGQPVAQGQVVGEVGHTGIARGTHLHFEYRERGQIKDPLLRFVGRPAA